MLTEVSSDTRLRSVPILLFASKQDQSGALLVSDIYSHFHQHLETRTYHIQPCSGITGEGLWAGIDWLIDAMKQQHREYVASLST